MPERASQILNNTRHVSRLVCTCEFWNGSAPPNSTVCADMWNSCGSGSVAVSVGVSLLLLLLLICGIGCVWHWRPRNAPQFAFPRFLKRRSNNKRDYAKSASVGPHVTPSRPKVLVQTHDHEAAARETDPPNSYENLEAGPPRAKDADRGLYENTRQPGFEDHIYGNEPSSEYCNFRKPRPPEEEDIYILPDLY
ncbi:protein GAPT [Molossus molossus]|nr:protein GAPT [Molossus molossus]